MTHAELTLTETVVLIIEISLITNGATSAGRRALSKIITGSGMHIGLTPAHHLRATISVRRITATVLQLLLASLLDVVVLVANGH